ncbi:MAG: hypothetical protein ACTSWZ_07670 [Candidatus Heimdallarchaeaceae archaeon]
MIEPVERIKITKDEIVIVPYDGPTETFNRKEWKLFAEDIRQLQDETSFGERRTLLIFPEGAGCQIEKGILTKRIFCGKHPRTMGVI